MTYQIKLEGELDQTWSNWLGNADIHTDRAVGGGLITTLTVDVVDQAALFGILDQIRDLNLVLLSVSGLF